MSKLTEALDRIKLAAGDLGGINHLAERAKMPADTARRLVGGSLNMMKNLRTLEAEADKVLAERK